MADKTPHRDPSQHGTITVTMYHTVAGGVPSPADVDAAVQDIEALYKACAADKRLVDCHEVTSELTVAQTLGISETLKYPICVCLPVPGLVDAGFPA